MILIYKKLKNIVNMESAVAYRKEMHNMFSEKPNICCVSLDWTLTFVILVIFLVGNFGLDLEFALSHSKFIFESSID